MKILLRQGIILLAALVCLAATGLRPSFAQSSGREYALKAAFLYHLNQFVEWPKARNGDAFRVCVLGADPFGEQLKVLETRSHQDKPISIAYPRTAVQAKECQILYLSIDSAPQTAAILQQLRGEATLTVSSAQGFVDQGGMVGFIVDQGKLRIEVNTATARRAGLKMSSKLLEVVKRVVDQEPGG